MITRIIIPALVAAAFVISPAAHAGGLLGDLADKVVPGAGKMLDDGFDDVKKRTSSESVPNVLDRTFTRSNEPIGRPANSQPGNSDPNRPRGLYDTLSR